MQLPSTGELFEDRYLLAEVIGQGGFAKVYRATDQRMQREVAIKVFSSKEDEGYAADRAARFLREARVAGTLQDPHVVALFDFGKAESGLLYLVFEFVEGRDLRQILFNDGPIEPMAVLHILEQLLGALREAHSKGILHRDIKPANILMFSYGDDPYQVKLADFGIAKPFGTDATNITAEGGLVGTLRYMSPEQAVGEELDGRSDIFSLGLVAYELFDARRAITATNGQDVLRDIVLGDPIRLPQSWAPEPLARVVERMLERDLADRYGNCDEVLRDLRTVRRSLRGARGQTASETSAPSEPVPPQPVLPQPVAPSRSPLVVIGLSGTVVVVLIMMLSLIPTVPKVVPAPPPSRIERTNPLAASEHATESTPDSGLPTADLGARTAGCGRRAPGVDVQQLSGFDGLTKRQSRVYIPKNYDPELPHPVLVLFPGIKQGAATMMTDLHLYEYADRVGMVVVMPRSAKSVLPWGPDVLDEAHDSLTLAEAQLCLDPKRVVVLGHSVGGRAAQIFACGMAEAPAGLVVLGHRLDVTDDPCAPRAPYLLLAPLDDGRAPRDGGIGCLGLSPVRSLAEHEDVFRQLQHCSSRDPTVTKHKSGECYEWDCEEPLVSCHLKGGRPLEARFAVSTCEGKPLKFPYGKVVQDFIDRSLGHAAE